MPRIETYPFDLVPTVNDYVIGTDGDNLNFTKNYKVMTFLDYLGTQYNLNSTDMLFEYDDVISTSVGNGYVSTNNYADATILMSGVTNIYVSKLTGFGVLVENAINSLGTNTLTIMFADMGNRNNYGIFDVVSAVDVDANTINLTVTATTTLGTLSAGKSMGIRIGIGGSGETNTVGSLGGGTVLFGSKIGAVLNFKSLIGGTNVSLTSDANTITINGAAIPVISDVAYDATTWNGNTDGASKNAIRDKIESLSSGAAGGILGFNATPYTNVGTGWETAATITAASAGLSTANGDAFRFRAGGTMIGATGTKNINLTLALDAGDQGLNVTNYITVTTNGTWSVDVLITRTSPTAFVLNTVAYYYTTTGGTTKSVPSVGVNGTALTFATTTLTFKVKIASTVASTITFQNATVEFIPAL